MWVQVSPVFIHGLRSRVRLHCVHTQARLFGRLGQRHTLSQRARSSVYVKYRLVSVVPRGKRRQMSGSSSFFFHGAAAHSQRAAALFSKPCTKVSVAIQAGGHKRRLSPIVLCRTISPCRCCAAVTRYSRVSPLPPPFSSSKILCIEARVCVRDTRELMYVSRYCTKFNLILISLISFNLILFISFDTDIISLPLLTIFAHLSDKLSVT